MENLENPMCCPIFGRTSMDKLRRNEKRLSNECWTTPRERVRDWDMDLSVVEVEEWALRLGRCMPKHVQLQHRVAMVRMVCNDACTRRRIQVACESAETQVGTKFVTIRSAWLCAALLHSSTEGTTCGLRMGSCGKLPFWLLRASTSTRWSSGLCGTRR